MNSQRAVFPLITAFFLVMNILLWRAEFSSRRDQGSAIPVDVVWRRILTAPDDSALEITRSGKKLGYCRWAANIGESVATGRTLNEEQPEGMVRQPADYTIDLEGNFIVAEPNSRLRFIIRSQFSTNSTWQKMDARFGLRPYSLELHASSTSPSLKAVLEDDQHSKAEYEFTMEDLRNPQKLISEFGLPILPGMLPSGISSLSSTNLKSMNLGLEWQAYTDWFQLGHSRIRVYRLEARILDKQKITVLVSRVGEILRIELPGNILLQNDVLAGF